MLSAAKHLRQVSDQHSPVKMLRYAQHDTVKMLSAAKHDTSGLAFIVVCSHSGLSIVYYDRTCWRTKG